MRLWIVVTFTFLICVSYVGAGSNTVIGIDLGTTYSCVAIFRAGRVEVIPNDQGNRLTPSWVAFGAEEQMIGDTAKQAFHTIPSQTVFNIKRLIGRKIGEEGLLSDTEHWPFKVVDHGGRLSVQVESHGEVRYFTPQEISAMILRKLKETAEMYLGVAVDHAVITVPAYFNDAQRHATKDAGTLAGLNVLRIVNEPTAAAIAYGLEKGVGRNSKLVVCDLGGGTFDVSLLRVENGVFEVLATAGDSHLGGEDFNERIINFIIHKYQRETNTNVANNQRAIAKLRREVEKAKRTLSSLSTTRLEIESFEGGNDFSFLLTRAKFEELNIDLFKRTVLPLRKVLGDAGVEIGEIRDIVLVGGSTRIPKIQQVIKEFFKGKTPRMGINPDEAVAYGAAIQGAILSGEAALSNIVLIEACQTTLGIETTGGAFSPLISRNTPLPVRKTEMYSTATDNQRTVTIKIFQGDRPTTKDNVLLGTFDLTGIPPAARGIPQIEVIFEVDNSGMITVAARNKESGNLESITIQTNNDRLSDTDIDQMSSEIMKLSEEDEVRRIRGTKLNELQAFIADSRSRLQAEPLFEHHEISSRLREGGIWAESTGQSATVTQLSERLLELKSAVDRFEAKSLSLVPEKIHTSPSPDAGDMKPSFTLLGGVRSQEDASSTSDTLRSSNPATLPTGIEGEASLLAPMSPHNEL